MQWIGRRCARDLRSRGILFWSLADWIASGADGQSRALGTNVFVLDANAKIEAVIGFSK
jgi:hypothetical protein